MEISKRSSKFLILALFSVFIFLLFFEYCNSTFYGGATSTVEIQVTGQVGAPPEIPPYIHPFYPPVLPAEVIFQGKAYPSAFLTILKDGQVTATFWAESSGVFVKKLTGLRPGRYVFEIWAEDTDGRRSVALSFEVDLLAGMVTTISRIFIPPTIEISAEVIKRGEELSVFGQAFPETKINIFIIPEAEKTEDIEMRETKTDKDGRWLYILDSTPLRAGDYRVKVKAIAGEGEQSEFSQALYFSITRPPCMGADLNFDGKVDLIDFSILLYFWKQEKPVNICADINGDNIVDIVDFSIMMYEWTG